MSVNIEDLTGEIGELGLNPTTPKRLFGGGAGVYLREETSGDDINSLLPADDPVLESPDFPYDDIRTMKQVDVMVLNTTATAVEVYCSGRKYLGIPASYQDVPLVTWTPEIQDSMGTFKTIVGRVLRYKFVIKNSRLCIFSGYSEGVQARKAEA